MQILLNTYLQCNLLFSNLFVIKLLMGQVNQSSTCLCMTHCTLKAHESQCTYHTVGQFNIQCYGRDYHHGIACSAGKLSWGALCILPICNLYLLSTQASIILCRNACCTVWLVSRHPCLDGPVMTDLVIWLQDGMQPHLRPFIFCNRCSTTMFMKPKSLWIISNQGNGFSLGQHFHVHLASSKNFGERDVVCWKVYVLHE